MKKFFAFVAAALVAFSFTACDDKNPSSDPTKLTFKIEASNIEAQSATITVTPSNDTIAYYWAYASEAMLESYEMTAEEFCADDLEYYLGQGYGYADLVEAKMIVKGKDVYEASQLTAESKYYVYACAVDEELNILSDIAVASFTTPEFEVKGEEALELSGAQYLYQYYEEYSEGFLQINAEIPAKDAVLSLALEVPAADGTFTEANMYEPYVAYGYNNYYNYIYSEASGLDLTFVTLSVTGALNEEAKQYTFSGEAVCDDGIKYTFSAVADEYVEEGEEEGGEEATAPKRGAKKVAPKAIKRIAKK